MNEKPLKKITINDSVWLFYFSITMAVLMAICLLILILVFIELLQTGNYSSDLFQACLAIFVILPVAIFLFWDAYKICKSNKYYISDILVKNDSFDIVYKKGLKTVRVRNIKISEIKDLKLEVGFILISPERNTYDCDNVKFYGSIYPKDGTEAIKFPDEGDDAGVTKFIDLYNIIKYFRVFDFFHLEFLNEGGCARKEFEYFLEHGEESPELKKEAIKSLGQGIILLFVLSLIGFLLSVCIVFFMLRPDIESLFGGF